MESWVYPNAASRTSASGFVAGDIGRISYQSDTGGYWRLTATTPTWARIASSPFATLQTVATSPAQTASTVGVMAGLAGIITPAVSGKIFVSIAGTIRNDTAGDGANVQIRYGTGSAPANGAAATGTSIGGLAQTGLGGYTANTRAPFSLSAVISGLVVGTAAWLDLAQVVVTGGNCILANVAISAHELP